MPKQTPSPQGAEIPLPKQWPAPLNKFFQLIATARTKAVSEKQFKEYVRWAIETEQQAIRDDISDLEENKGFAPNPSLAVKIVRETGKPRPTYIPGVLSAEREDALLVGLISQRKKQLLTAKQLDKEVERRLSKISEHGIPTPAAWTQEAIGYKTYWSMHVKSERTRAGKKGGDAKANRHTKIGKAKTKKETNPTALAVACPKCKSKVVPEGNFFVCISKTCDWEGKIRPSVGAAPQKNRT